jgi:hypothetical protein
MFDLILVAVLALLAVFGGGGLYMKGRKDADNANTMQEQDDYIDTRKRMDEARRDLGEPSDDDVTKWLRERGKSGRGL